MRHFRIKRRGEDAASVDMTPMLDIVFIMLIFFIVTSVFLDEHGLDFTTPPRSTGPEPPHNTIQIFVDAKHRVSVDRVPVQLSGVSARVERLLSDKPQANILLMASYKAKLGPVVYIKDELERVKLKTAVKIVRH